MVKKKAPAPSTPPKQRHNTKTPMQHAAEAVNRAAEALTSIHGTREKALESLCVQLYHDLFELREMMLSGDPRVRGVK